MKYLFTFLLLSFASFEMIAQEQSSNKEWKKFQRDTDLSHAGIGIDFGNPNLGKEITTQKDWVGINLTYSFLVGGYGQGVMGFEGADPNYTYNARNFYFGVNLPLKLLNIGRYKSYNNVFRMVPFIQTTYGQNKFSIKENDILKAHELSLMPGLRLRLPYLCIDAGIEGNWNIIPKDNAFYPFIEKFTINPKLTVRIDGLLGSFNSRSVLVNGAYVSSQYTGTTYSRGREYVSGYGYADVTYATDHYNVKTTPTTVSLTDIGPYLGVGIRAGTNGFITDYYTPMGYTVGLNILTRKSQIILGINIEYAKVGHATTTNGGAGSPKGYKREINKKVNEGMGYIHAINGMIDLGVDLNRFIMAMGGLVLEDHEATPYLSINGGYSLGYSYLFKQSFLDSTKANAYLQRQIARDKYNDGSQSKSGFVGAWFLGTDIGATSFRISWYKYKGAPLAQNINLSMAWRFSAKKGEKH